MSDTSSNLAKIIAIDLLTVGRIPLLLLVLIFATAMGVVLTTHNSRQAITHKDEVLVEREHLDSEWRNLMIEESSLADHSRVQDIATKQLNMIRPDGAKEVVIRKQ